MDKITGGCLCGDIKYEASGDPIASLSCYCRDCQYISGGQQNSTILMPTSSFEIIKGAPRSYTSSSDSSNQVSRLFCGTCGTPLFAKNEALQDFISIKVGSLDNPSLFKSSVNLWVSSAQPWHFIDPELPKYDTQPT